MHDSGQCADCGRAIDGADQAFCPACGQPTPAHRIDWHFLGHELEHSVLHMDRGILYSLKRLMLRPGHFIRDYIDGRRARHVKPLALIMILAAVMVLLARYVLAGDVMGSALVAGGAASVRAAAAGQFDPARFLAAYQAVTGWMNGHYAAATLLLLPLEAAALKLAFRRVGDLNYPEWLVITTFLTAQTFVVMILAMPLERRFPEAHGWALALALLYSVVSLVQFFTAYPRWKTVLRSLLGFGMFMLVNVAFGAVLAAVVWALPVRP